MTQLPFALVRAFTQRREVDLVLATPRPPFSLCLRGQFDGYSHFFSIFAADVEYLEIAGGATVGDMRLLPDVREVRSVVARWDELLAAVSGPALVLRGADADSWESASSNQLFLVVANRIVFEGGPDWSDP